LFSLKGKEKMSTKVILSVGPRSTIEVEGESSCDIFEGLSTGYEIFGHGVCGCCQSENIKFLVRTSADEDKFYEMACNEPKCRARLPFGCLKKPKGGMYPKLKWDSLSPSEKVNRASQESECRSGYLPNDGWFRFKPNVKPDESPAKEEPANKNKTGKAPF
jgi:hypothetical protein